MHIDFVENRLHNFSSADRRGRDLNCSFMWFEQLSLAMERGFIGNSVSSSRYGMDMRCQYAVFEHLPDQIPRR